MIVNYTLYIHILLQTSTCIVAFIQATSLDTQALVMFHPALKYRGSMFALDGDALSWYCRGFKQAIQEV